MTEEEKELLKKFEGKVKQLPRYRNGKLKPIFEANGNKYVIWDWRDGLPVDRWHVYQLMSIQLGYGASLNQIHENIEKADKMLNDILRGDNSKSAIDVVYHLRGINKGIINEATARHPLALKQCTIFILREDEDIHTWDETTANAKMDDWAKEGFATDDFFRLAKTSLMNIRKRLTDSMEVGFTEKEKEKTKTSDTAEDAS